MWNIYDHTYNYVITVKLKIIYQKDPTFVSVCKPYSIVYVSISSYILYYKSISTKPELGWVAVN